MWRRAAAAAVGLVALASLTGCGGEDYTDAQQACVDALERKYGEDGLVDVDDLTEVSSSVRTKVEGSVVYRYQQGAGDRVDTWFTCQLDNTGAVESLTLSEEGLTLFDADALLNKRVELGDLMLGHADRKADMSHHAVRAM